MKITLLISEWERLIEQIGVRLIPLPLKKGKIPQYAIQITDRRYPRFHILVFKRKIWVTLDFHLDYKAHTSFTTFHPALFQLKDLLLKYSS